MTTRQAGGIALVLIVISTLLMGVFRSVELVEERRSLSETRNQQDRAVEEAAKLRRQFDALAAGVVRPAAEGNGNAKTIVDEMRRRGVTLPPAQP